MKYIKENWRELLIFMAGGLVIGFMFSITWKYSPYVLYSRINTIESHTNDLAQSVISLKKYDEANEKNIQSLNYLIDVLSERYLQDKLVLPPVPNASH